MKKFSKTKRFVVIGGILIVVLLLILTGCGNEGMSSVEKWLVIPITKASHGDMLIIATLGGFLGSLLASFIK